MFSNTLSSRVILSGLGFVLLLFSPKYVYAQDVDLESISKQDPVKVNGSFSAFNRFYGASGIEDRQENYIWTLSGRVNLSVYGVAIPIAATITSQNSSVTQPYNRFSIRPSYKWAKAYLGYSNMTFSSYTLAGHTFLGAGVELYPPNKIRIAANYGRFATAIPLDQPTNQVFVPSFDRFGYGGKIGYGDNNNYIDLIYFNARDEADSWQTIPDSSTVTPAENMVLGTAWKFSKIKNLIFSGEFARSAYTLDSRDGAVDESNVFSALGYDIKSSTLFRNAFKAALSYRLLRRHLISGKYERIGPNYQTMGAYFFNNDLENITAAYASTFFKNRLSFSVNGGLQRNNVANRKASQVRRTIAAGNIVYAKNPFSVGVSFSNYSSDISYVLNESLDSLNAVVVTTAVTLFGTYILPFKEDNSHSISANISNQRVSDDFTSPERSADNHVVNGLINYTIRFKKNGDQDNVTFRFNYNRNDLGTDVSTRLGPGISATKTFLHKLRTTATLNYLTQEDNRTLNILLNAALSLKSMHTLSFTLTYFNRSLVTGAVEDTPILTNFGETTAIIVYSINF